MKTYRGNPVAARAYVEAGRARADEYYLAEGTGIAAHFVASPATGVRELVPLTGDAYQAWVGGFEPATNRPKGSLRHDERAVRFVEVVVNGPKSWSLAAALHEDISTAYDAAQDRAAQQIIGWLAQHASTRVGPRGAQIQVPVEALEAAVVRHHSSRAGDPHRHLHLQINARVLAEGRWRGLHTVGVRDSLDAVNGIGHAAVMTDPGFRAALAGHGYTLDPDSGEIRQLAGYVGPFSARTAQIARNVDRYEADWRTANPGREPGAGLRQTWDRRAWAEARPDKITPRTGTDMTREWVAELRILGYREPRRPARIDAASVGSIDRDAAVDETLTRLAARRSAWNAADIRGQIEYLLARRNIVTNPAVRTELAEDLTARTLAACVPLLDRPGLPEHLRALTSQRVLAVETDLVRRLIARAETPKPTPTALPARSDDELDVAQREVVAALTGDRPLVAVEGAAGAGKTTTLAATRAALEQSGHRLVVVTPSRKAARVAAEQVGAEASSAAWLVHQHGYRWSDHDGWTRLTPGQVDPVTGTIYHGPEREAQLLAGDLLVCDEAGMLDQDTAQALLTLADQAGARVALIGDRHQLPAVGRGGVLDLAARYTPADACLMLDTIHRFSDPAYARLSLAMRTGENPETVFDTLLAGGHIRLHASEPERRQALAHLAAEAIITGQPAALIADTREQVAELNASIRERLIAAGRVDDTYAVTTNAGQRVGVGDRVATRRNHPNLQVANRDTWIIKALTTDGSVTVAGAQGTRTLPAGYAREHLELAYATTVHGAQGDTVTAGHLVMGEHTAAAAAYVGMTRARQVNTAHLVAATVEDAREQWIDTFTRDRADLGPAHTAHLAQNEAARYARLRPLEDVLRELHQAWTAQADTHDQLTQAERLRDGLANVVALRQGREDALRPLTNNLAAADLTCQQATATAQHIETAVTARAADLSTRLRREWDQQRDTARHAAQIVQAGPGRFGQRRGAVRQATEQLGHWSATWQPYLPGMPTHPDDIANLAAGYDDTTSIRDALGQYARTAAEREHPDYAPARATAARAQQRTDQASRAYDDTAHHYNQRLARYGRLARIDNPETVLTELDQQLSTLRRNADTARERVSTVLAEPTLRAQPADRLTTEHARWQAHRQAERDTRDRLRRVDQLRHATRPDPHRPATPQPGHGISR